MPELFPPDRRNNIRSQSLDLLRFPLAVVVASIHVIASRSYPLESTHMVHVEKMEGADWFFAFFDAFLRGQSVPIYYFIAGYVFFLGIELTMDTYAHKLRNRTHSLLYPYLSWNALAILVTFSLYLPEMQPLFHPDRMFRLDFSAKGLLECFWNSWYGIFSRIQEFPAGGGTYPQDYPLWFVRDLMIIVLGAPVIAIMLKTTRSYAVILLGLAWLALSPVKTGHPGQILTGVFFFSWGAYMSYNHKDMMVLFRRWSNTAIATYLVLGLLHIGASFKWPEACSVIKSLNAIAGMVMAYGIAARLIESKKVKVSRFLSAAAFFVYAGHGIFVAYFNMLFFRLFSPMHIWSVALCYLLTLICTVGMLLMIFRVLGIVCRPVQKIFGGRAWPASPKTN